jgi:Rps23 Pro-64 3,4-dihydroxylase Tpa1-like proline 4-hydroxylase
MLTGIEGLLPDPHMQGGGIHQIHRGGFLRVHADFNKHPKFGLDRRLNLLLYLNKDWQEEYGGEIELWSRDMARCERRILPTARRCLIFSTLSDSYHGHPHPLTCPEGMTRKSIAMYYYTNGRPAEEQRPQHGTLWQKLPQEG